MGCDVAMSLTIELEGRMGTLCRRRDIFNFSQKCNYLYGWSFVIEVLPHLFSVIALEDN